jgi:hypothetical protein
VKFFNNFRTSQINYLHINDHLEELKEIFDESYLNFNKIKIIFINLSISIEYVLILFKNNKIQFIIHILFFIFDIFVELIISCILFILYYIHNLISRIITHF